MKEVVRWAECLSRQQLHPLKKRTGNSSRGTFVSYKKYPITIKLNTKIKSVASLSADEVIVATGATARKINVTGAETAIEAIDYLLGSRKVGENVAVIGGRFDRM